MISIHAPTKGATGVKAISGATTEISIHAPTKGATKDVASDATITKFQSTLPRRERHYTTRSTYLQN